MLFGDIIGQKDIKQRLLHECEQGRIPHALLFCGPEGCGKLPMALAYACYLLCERPNGTERCNSCPACFKLDKLVHPDLHFAFPVIKKGSAKEATSDLFLPEWRNLLTHSAYIDSNSWLEAMGAENQQALIYAAESDEIRRKLMLKSSEGGRKIMIIWQAERMNVQAANKLLKLLEEPPADTVFILVSNEPERLLSTITSRTQRITFHKLSDDEISDALQQRNGLSEEDARHIARTVNGNYTAALQTISTRKDEDIFFDSFTSLMRLSYQRKIKDMMKWSEEVASWGRERQKHFLGYCQRLIRENFIYNFHRPELNYLSTEEARFSTRFARFVNERNVIGISEELAAAQRDIEQNVNPKMVFFDFSLKMIVLLIQ